MKSGPTAPPFKDVGSKNLNYGPTKKEPRGGPGRETPLKGPLATAPGDTGKSSKMPTGKHTEGTLGGMRGKGNPRA